MAVNARRPPSGDREGNSSAAVLAVSFRRFSRLRSSDLSADCEPPVAKESTACRLSGIQLACGTKLKSILAKRRRGVPLDSGKGSSQICGVTPLVIKRMDAPSGEKRRLLPSVSSGTAKGAGWYGRGFAPGGDEIQTLDFTSAPVSTARQK